MMNLLEIFAKKDDLCSIDGTGKCNKDWTFTDLIEGFGGNIISSLFVIAGIMSVIMIIVCAIMMMTSAGDPGKVAKAKKGLIAAIIGLIISLSAFTIATAIVNAFN
jgi:hypothetical protein